MKTAICTLLLAAASFAQILTTTGDGVYPNNTFGEDPNAHQYPDDQFQLQYCVYLNYNGVLRPLVGQAYTLGTSTTAKSGFHAHEGVGSLARPQATFLGTTTGFTGSNGCALVTVELPNIAGWYTFTGDSPNTPTKGVNFFAQYYTVDATGSHPELLIPYPDNPVLNVQQSFHQDQRHLDGVNGHVFSRYIDANTVTEWTQLSQAYKTASTAMLGIVDRADITRCSLPYGGIADNDSYAFAPSVILGFEWQSRAFEEHARGAECDIVNPKTISMTSVNLMYSAITANNCLTGAFSMDGSYLGATKDNFWLAQDKFHVICGINNHAGLKKHGPQ